MNDPQHVGPPHWLTLDPGEMVHIRTAPSKNLLLAGIGGGMILLICVSVVVAAIGNIETGRVLSFTVVMLVMALLGAIYLFVHWWEYTVTSDRVCVVRGFRSRETRTVSLDAVEKVTLEQSRWQRLVNGGDLLFVTERGMLRFDAVENPLRLRTSSGSHRVVRDTRTVRDGRFYRFDPLL